MAGQAKTTEAEHWDRMLDEAGCDDADDFDEDPGAECGRWSNGRLMAHCSKAGSEECDWECPYGR